MVLFERKNGDKAPSSGSDGPRNGKLLGELETPAFTIPTQRGLPMYISPDLLEKAPQGMLQIPLSDMLVSQDAVSKASMTGKKFFGFDRFSYMSFRNLMQANGNHGGDVVAIDTPAGRRKVGAKDLANTQRTMKMDIITAPGEEVPCGAGGKRVTRSVKRANEMLEELLAEENLDCHILANIQGASNIDARKKAIESEVVHKTAGFYIGGLGYQENAEARQAVLDVVCKGLPAEKPRFVACGGSPLEVLQAVAAGADVVESVFPFKLAQEGYALVFEVPEVKANGGETDATCQEAAKTRFVELVQQEPKTKGPFVAGFAEKWMGVKVIDLRNAEFTEDLAPLTADSAVKQYSRAYIRHLFACNELLGTILLTLHNLTLYAKFFESIRSSIDEDTFFEFAGRFVEQQACEPKAARPVVPMTGDGKKRRRLPEMPAAELIGTKIQKTEGTPPKEVEAAKECAKTPEEAEQTVGDGATTTETA